MIHPVGMFEDFFKGVFRIQEASCSEVQDLAGSTAQRNTPKERIEPFVAVDACPCVRESIQPSSEI